jgi:hypothetical protein
VAAVFVQGFGMNSADLTQVVMPGSDVVVAGGAASLAVELSVFR